MRWQFLDFARGTDLVRTASPVLDLALDRLLDRLKPAIDRPHLATVTEDYIVYRIEALRDGDGTSVSASRLHDEDLAPRCSARNRWRPPRCASCCRIVLVLHDDLAILGWCGSLVVEPIATTPTCSTCSSSRTPNCWASCLRPGLDRELPRSRADRASRTGAVLLGRRFAPLLRRTQSLVAEPPRP
jgi:hypothetical protein